MIAVVDYNMGNLSSVKNAFLKIGKNVDIVKDGDKLKNYDKIVLPGVGAFGDAMEHLKQNSLDEAIVEFAKSGKSLLGICLGMQLLFEKSYEFGEHKGLSLIKGEVAHFNKSKMGDLDIPHMGWNKLFIERGSELFHSLPSSFYLYFIHSYHVVCENDKNIIGSSYYGYKFTSSVNYDNIYGFQPHPEKSHDIGLKILENFVNRV